MKYLLDKLFFRSNNLDNVSNDLKNLLKSKTETFKDKTNSLKLALSLNVSFFDLNKLFINLIIIGWGARIRT